MLKEGQTKASKYNISFSNSDSDSPLSRTLNKQINKFGLYQWYIIKYVKIPVFYGIW